MRINNGLNKETDNIYTTPEEKKMSTIAAIPDELINIFTRRNVT